MDEYSTSGSDAVLEYKFLANKVFLVMRPSEVGAVGAVRVFIDGKPVRVVTVDSDRLYDLVDFKGNRGEHLLRIEFSPGIEIFAFTFG